MKIYDFRIEYREQPKGLAVKIPRFSWKIASGDNNVVQTAWHLIVSSAEKCFWDSGKIESDQSVLVPYAGQALTREQEYQVSLKSGTIMEIEQKQKQLLQQVFLIPEIFRPR